MSVGRKFLQISVFCKIMKLIQLWNDMKTCKLHNFNFWVNYFFIFFFLMLYCLFKIWLLSRATLVTFEGCNVQHQTWPKSPSEQEILRLFCCMLSPNCAMDSDKLQSCVGSFCWVQRFEALTEPISTLVTGALWSWQRKGNQIYTSCPT